MEGWGWIFMSFGTLLFVALIGLAVWLAIRATSSASRPTAAGDSAREILAQRYARGEIDEREYQQRSRVLSG
jgi:putative membrane protein